MNEMQTFYPWCVVAAFSDGSRSRSAVLLKSRPAAQWKPPATNTVKYPWWDHVTDTNYVDGQYYQLLPDLPTLHVVDLAGYDGPVDKNGFPAGLPDKIARYAVEHGAAEDEAQVIVRMHERWRRT